MPKMSYNVHMMKDIEVTNWLEIRDDFCRLNSELAQIIDDINPSKEMRIYRARYPYGSEFVQKGHFFLPYKGRLTPISDRSLPKEIRDDLSYNLGSSPVSFVMDKSLEVYMNLPNREAPLPFALVPPGHIFSTSVVLQEGHQCHHPAFLWNLSSGARSIFALPKISKEQSYQRIRKKYGCNIHKPADIFEHWDMFKGLYDANLLGEWDLDIIYFSERWFSKLNSDRFFKFKSYMQRQRYVASAFWRNQFVWDTYFSVVNNLIGIKPNPLIYDTVRHLLVVAMGCLPGLAPACDNEAAPIEMIQKILIDDYQLEKYPPTIMQLKYFSMYQKSQPVYYSLNYPNAMELSLSKNEEISTIAQLYEAKNLLNYYLSQLVKNDLNISKTVMFDISKKVNFDFFHSSPEGYRDIRNTKELFEEDSNLRRALCESNNSQDPYKTSFVRGCIKISN